jgi:hypothetical protein
MMANALRILVTVQTQGLGVTNGFVKMPPMTLDEANNMIAIMAERVGSFTNLRLDLEGGGVVGFPEHLLERSILTFKAVS